jgi:hypothetical protein
MDTWTALTISYQRASDLQREADRHRLARLAVASRKHPSFREPSSYARQSGDSDRTGGFTNLLLDSRRRLFS